MILRDVERAEIVPIVLDLRTGRDREAQIGENLGELVHHLADRVNATLWPARNGQGHVQRFGRELAVEFGRFQRSLAGGDRARDALPQAVDGRARGQPLLGRHLAQALQQRGDHALLAERGDTLRLQRRQVRRRVDARQKLFGVDFHAAPLRRPHTPVTYSEGSSVTSIITGRSN
jgi:hypothetical protein